jgi:acyl-CoA thioester hydrolase
MKGYRFYHAIEVRYGDLDPQGHVNNAKYLTFMEQTRAHYLIHLGLWEGQSFMDIGIILAEARVTFLAPIFFIQKIRVGARVARIGTKSLSMEYGVEDIEGETVLASGEAVLVAYDYRVSKTIPVPDFWRQAIAAFEGMDLQE